MSKSMRKTISRRTSNHLNMEKRAQGNIEKNYYIVLRLTKHAHITIFHLSCQTPFKVALWLDKLYS